MALFSLLGDEAQCLESDYRAYYLTTDSERLGAME